jgi:hypothetical protein
MSFDKKTNSFRVESKATMIGIADDVTNNKWKFMTLDANKQIFPMLFNEKIQKELGI